MTSTGLYWMALANVKWLTNLYFFNFPGINASIRNKTNVTHATFLLLIFWFSLSVTQKENKDESVLQFYANCHLAFCYQKRNRTFAVHTKNVT
jgi:hypothetical protein